MDIFVTQLKKAMFLKGWRQIDLVRATGLTDSQISSWYNGRYRPNGEAMAKIAKALGVTVDYLLGKEEVPVSKLTLPQLHEIPVLGKVAAGVPIEAQEDIIGTVATDKNVFALRISGDSMSPRIMDGDIVLVHQQESAEDGDIVIALIEGEATCKVLKKNAYGVTLVPFNAAYAPFIYTGQQAEDLRILGKVVESRHEWR
jgi:repressor LexA